MRLFGSDHKSQELTAEQMRFQIPHKDSQKETGNNTRRQIILDSWGAVYEKAR